MVIQNVGNMTHLFAELESDMKVYDEGFFTDGKIYKSQYNEYWEVEDGELYATKTTRFYKKDDSITDMFSVKKIVNMEFTEVGQSKNTKQNKILKTIIGTVGFLLMIGSVGAMENDTISLTQGIAQDLIGFGMLYWVTRGIK